MVGKRLFLYTKGDVTRIRNYQEAIRDIKGRYSVFHLNLLTPMGVVSSSVLDRIGKWYDCEPEELILLKKEVWKELCAKVGKATQHGHFGQTLKIWSEMNPGRLFMEMSKEEFELLHSSITRAKLIHAQMLARCYNPDSWNYKWYGAKGVGVCEEWRGEEGSTRFMRWSLEQGYRYRKGIRKGEQLSIDRIDPTKDYSPDNCRWITHSENVGRVRRGKNLNIRKYSERFFDLFPEAIGKFRRIDWSIVFVKYMDRDWKKMSKWIDEHMCVMTRCRIRRMLEEKGLLKEKGFLEEKGLLQKGAK